MIAAGPAVLARRVAPGRGRPARRRRGPVRRPVPARLRLEPRVRRRAARCSPSGVDLAERTRLQGLTDSLIWSSAAAASLGSGVVLAAASYTALGLLGAALVVVPLWLFIARSRGGSRRPPRPALGAAQLAGRPTPRGRGRSPRPRRAGRARRRCGRPGRRPGRRSRVGVAPSLTNSRMSAPYGSPSSAGRRPSVASAAAATETGSGWSAGTRDDENRPPVISTAAGMVAQERVGGAGRVDARPQVRLRVPPRLAEPHAVAALGDDPVEDRRGPLPSLDLADDRRVRQPEGGHQRIGLGGVAARSRRPRGPRISVYRLSSAETPSRRTRGVGGAARDGQPERDRAGVGDDDVEARSAR